MITYATHFAGFLVVIGRRDLDKKEERCGESGSRELQSITDKGDMKTSCVLDGRGDGVVVVLV
jgi:hypothetical protein